MQKIVRSVTSLTNNTYFLDQLLDLINNQLSFDGKRLHSKDWLLDTLNNFESDTDVSDDQRRLNSL